VAQGEHPAPASLDRAVRRQLTQDQSNIDVSCDKLCVCELTQLEGPALTSCQNDPDASAPPGFCYIDPSQGVGSATLVSDCPATGQRSLRYLGDRAPGNGSFWFIGCFGTSI
jgi:hypothetical protein